MIQTGREEAPVIFQQVSASGDISVHIEHQYRSTSSDNEQIVLHIISNDEELDPEKHEVENTLDLLGEIYAGVCSRTSQPGVTGGDQIISSKMPDVYIALLKEGDLSSAIEHEIRIATERDVPCLIYVKQQQSGLQDSVHNDSAFYSRLKILSDSCLGFFFFRDREQLRLQLTADLLKAFRRELLQKIAIPPQGKISLKSLKLLCESTIGDQTRRIGREKFLPHLYIERDIEKDIQEFASFDKVFFERFGAIIDILAQISKQHGLPFDGDQIRLHSKYQLKSLDEYGQLVNELKQSLYYEQTETLFRVSNVMVRLSREKEGLFQEHQAQIISTLDALPFLSGRKLPPLHQILQRIRRANIGNETEDIEIALLQIVPAQILACNEKGEPLKWVFANQLIKELERLIEHKYQKCAAIVSNAGLGKTSLICNIAHQLVKTNPVVLLSGQMELTSQHDIEGQIKDHFERMFAGSFSHWLDRLSNTTDRADQLNLFVLIDGINENSNLPLLIQALREFNAKIEDARVKLILTCRNIFWDLFWATLKNSLFDQQALYLQQFTPQESSKAIALYFQRYNIQADYDFEQSIPLCNPILLRFFCEAYRDRQLTRISSIELLAVFDLYLERIEGEINERFGFLPSGRLKHYLLQIGNAMWKQRRVSLDLDKLNLTSEELLNQSSLFNLLRIENLILAEVSQPYCTQRSLRFLFDEFMEYVIACSWFETIQNSGDSTRATESLAQEVTTALGGFSVALGATIFLDKMMKGEGRMLNHIFTLSAQFDDELIASRQIIMLSVLEHVATDKVSDELMIALNKFERIARDEIKEKLAPILIEIFQKRPDHPITREMISKMLEVGSLQQARLDHNEMPGDSLAKVPKQKTDQDSFFSRLIKNLISEKKDNNLDSGDKNQVESLIALPPGRYHYNEEIRLSAIGIVVGSQNSSDLLEEGISNLGRLDLHSALTALTTLDLAEDSLVYKMLSKYYQAYLPEYRIYCAWLLRNRYGAEPAHYLIMLLMDRDTRVHQYALGLFDNRHIEKEMLVSLLSSLNHQATIKSWHLMNMVKILRKKEKLQPQTLVQEHGREIADKLLETSRNHISASLRLEAYRSVLCYTDYTGTLLILKLMEKDQDSYVRREAQYLSQLRDTT